MLLSDHRLTHQIFLAMEERDANAAKVARLLISAFQKKFYGIQFTLHPGGIHGEAPGKSSNISWAARKVGEKFADAKRKSRVMITVMDGKYCKALPFDV